MSKGCAACRQMPSPREHLGRRLPAGLVLK